jgi:hypothetical protein
MKTISKPLNQERREFLIKAISSCTLCCLAGPKVLGLNNGQMPSLQDDQHKFLCDSGMSFQEVYEFAFRDWYIPAMKNLKEQVGHDQFLEMLKISSDKIQ